MAEGNVHGAISSQGQKKLSIPRGAIRGANDGILGTLETRSRLTDAEQASFSLDGQRLDDTFVVEHRGAGWLVFYWERGNKRDFVKHGSEAAACQDVWRRFHD